MISEQMVAGRAAFIYRGGRESGRVAPTVVFVHGAAHDHSVWTLQSRWFAHHGWNVLAPDLPGHGRSAGPALESIGALADWVIALLDASKVESACLVGHSMGSLAALETAARDPQRVTGIALVGCSAPMPVSEALLEAAREDEPAARAMINAWSFGPRARLGGNAVPGMWMAGANLRLMERSTCGALHTDLAACNRYADGLEAAARVRCPALLVCGERDQMTPPRATRPLLEALSDARQVLLPGCGHAVMAEQPDALLDALRAFIRLQD
ncbi:MAG: alpha/beta hydrolase [Betaproteobacteria bacterium]|nr:alpha/beta hydrolase [Betaproteobacteria bacterium]